MDQVEADGCGELGRLGGAGILGVGCRAMSDDGPCRAGPVRSTRTCSGYFPTLRQSLLAKHDDCALSSLMELRYARRLEYASAGARHDLSSVRGEGSCASCSRRRRDDPGRSVAERASRRCVPAAHGRAGRPEDIVRVPLRQMPELRMAARKFAKDNEFSVSEDRGHRAAHLGADCIRTPNGGSVTRIVLTGQLDALLFDPPDGAIVIDWKDTWALPPEPKRRAGRVRRRGRRAGRHQLSRLLSAALLRVAGDEELLEREPRDAARVLRAQDEGAQGDADARSAPEEVEEELSILAEAFDAARRRRAAVAVRLVAGGDGRSGEGARHRAAGALEAAAGPKHCGFCAGRGTARSTRTRASRQGGAAGVVGAREARSRRSCR
jgi:hypothetical protein